MYFKWFSGDSGAAGTIGCMKSPSFSPGAPPALAQRASAAKRRVRRAPDRAWGMPCWAADFEEIRVSTDTYRNGLLYIGPVSERSVSLAFEMQDR
jgi:hypothetical protein